MKDQGGNLAAVFWITRGVFFLRPVPQKTCHSGAPETCLESVYEQRAEWIIRVKADPVFDTLRP